MRSSLRCLRPGVWARASNASKSFPAQRSAASRFQGDEFPNFVEIEIRIGVLNHQITSAKSLGPQFRVGHSYVTPDDDETIRDSRAWFVAKVETEIGPLLDEYWYDDPATATAARVKLVAGFL